MLSLPARRPWRQQLVHDLMKEGKASSPSCNVSLVKRKIQQDKLDSLARLLHEEPSLFARATIHSSHYLPQIKTQIEEKLLIQCKSLRHHLGAMWVDEAAAFLSDDIASAVDIYNRARGGGAGGGEVDLVNVKLEAVENVRCPKWHADSVGLRLLITYVGQGTFFVENRHVKRSWDSIQGSHGDREPNFFSSVVSVDDSHASQAGTGDVLLLKGHKWQAPAIPHLEELSLIDRLTLATLQGSFSGLGAVHKSPESDESERRLLLTIDDVLQERVCDCGLPHK